MKLSPTKLGPKHDELFRKAMENPIVAQEFFQSHLPQEVKNIIDTNTLSLKNCSFVEQDLNTKISDLLFTVHTKHGEACIYLLLEHQSKPDKWMAFRLFKYMLNICERYRTENPRAKHLPLIYPMVFYNGKQRYNVPRNLWGLFKDFELAKKFWTEDYHLVNLNEIPDEEIKKRQASGILEFFMKHIHARNMLQKWEEIAPFLREIEVKVGEDYIKLFLSYTLTLIEKNDTIKLKELLVQNLSEEKGESTVASFAEHWYTEGMNIGLNKGKLEGMMEGKLEGKLEGKMEGKMEDAVNMLKFGIDMSITSKITGLPISQLKKLKKLH